jgi:hypothetical protein
MLVGGIKGQVVVQLPLPTYLALPIAFTHLLAMVDSMWPMLCPQPHNTTLWLAEVEVAMLEVAAEQVQWPQAISQWLPQHLILSQWAVVELAAHPM